MVSFSVVIPSRNRPQFLPQAVASVLAQGHLPREIIVVDDGEGAARSLARLEGPITVLDNRQQGPVPARQRGIEAATGDVIAFLDDDDFWTDPAYLVMAAAAFEQGADLTYGDGAMVFDDGRPSLPFGFDATPWTLERDNTVLISSVAYRRALHYELGHFDLALPYYWDWDWYLRIARANKILRRIASPVVAIRVHTQNMSGDQQEAARSANLRALEAKHGLAPIPLKNHLNLVQDKPPERA